jgi:mannitol operon transcriptional antiterminator
MILTEMSPRLARLLDVLLAAEEPVKVDSLAAALEISRRTVFRELENAGEIVALFQAEIASVPGKGIIFSGSDEARNNLYIALNQCGNQPSSKRERLFRLVIEILANIGEIQKLFYYADTLKVSESTVSNDLDELEGWFIGHGIKLTRKSGVGVFAAGTEEAARVTLVSRFLTDGDTGGRSYTAAFGYPGHEVEQGIREALRRVGGRLDWMTCESYTMISLYLMVMVKRFCEGKVLVGECPNQGMYQIRLARILTDEIADIFAISLPSAEMQALAAKIQACRAKQLTPVELGSLERQALIQTLVYNMIERFDPPIAAILRTNENFVSLLSRHLGSSLTRISEGMEHPNQQQTELINNYPDVFEKTCRAVTALEDYLGLSVPVSEIAFIEIHFLAALSVLGERDIRKRVLRAGIICVSGIGMSYMLASQIRRRFIGELELDILGWDDRSSWEKYDFLISTIPLEQAEKPVVLAQPLLTTADYGRIQETINTYAFAEHKVVMRADCASPDNWLKNLEYVLSQTRALLDNFTIQRINADCSFEELARFAAARFTPSGQESIYTALMAREKIDSQVIADLKIVLFHARSAVVAVPVFAVIVPDEKAFTANYLKGAKSCVLMLVPERAAAEVFNLMGSISSAIIDVPAFLEALWNGDERTIKTELSDTLIRYCKGNLVK